MENDAENALLGPHILEHDGNWYAVTNPLWPEEGRKIVGPKDSADAVFDELYS